MSIQPMVQQAQEYMISQGVDGWLVYDYLGLNPILSDTVGRVGHVTRPVWLWIPRQGDPHMLVSFVDQSRFTHLGLDTTLFVNRKDMIQKLKDRLGPSSRIAMEYTPDGALPRVSKVDAGTLEMVRGLGADVVSSADLLQYATQRWTEEQLRLSPLCRGKADSDRAGGLRAYRTRSGRRNNRVPNRRIHSQPFPRQWSHCNGRTRCRR